MSETGDVPLRLTARGPGSRAEIAAPHATHKDYREEWRP